MRKKASITILLLILCFAQTTALAQEKEVITPQKTWTYTYLKAKDNEKQSFKTFLIKNWFAMDSIAVSRGLFNDYKLIENTNEDAAAEWDFIVAVEYFTAGTYSDIEKEWQDIRKNHKTVLVDGKAMSDLGSFVKSEIVRNSYEKSKTSCAGDHIDLIKPFIGQWHEFLVTDDSEELYGRLDIQ